MVCLQEYNSSPLAYLEDLRNIEMDEDGNLLTFNFRDTQYLNNHPVLCFEEVGIIIIIATAG